jgi:hypothetical protein
VTKPRKVTLAEIAERINAHLKRFETDPQINKRDSTYRLLPYWNAYARLSGNRVRITYISHQGDSSVCRQDAEKYLAWLDAGNVGHHWEALRDVAARENAGASE